MEGFFSYSEEIKKKEVSEREKKKERGRGARLPPQPEGLSFLKSEENKDEIAMQLKELYNTPKPMH